MSDAVTQAKVFHQVGFEVIPVLASVALFVFGIWKQNLAFVSAGAGVLGLPGIAKAVATIRTERDDDA